MRDSWSPEDGGRYSAYLKKLHISREKSKSDQKRLKRKRGILKPEEREEILTKTDSRCHICGGEIEGDWQADHVLSHSKRGEHLVENYLAAHKVCNNYRWDYLSEEFQEIMKIGVWMRSQIEKGTKLGEIVADRFVKYEKRRVARRK